LTDYKEKNGVKKIVLKNTWQMPLYRV
jgi:hypothetical protein